MTFRNIGISPDGTCHCDCEDVPVKMELDIQMLRVVCPNCGSIMDQSEVHKLLSRRSASTVNEDECESASS